MNKEKAQPMPDPGEADAAKDDQALPTAEDQDLTEEELRLLADTMPGEGPGDD